MVLTLVMIPNMALTVAVMDVKKCVFRHRTVTVASLSCSQNFELAYTLYTEMAE